ncbi:ABC transporter substrate-binding protein [Paenibacillus periandrae]|uniref:ABC transporter substrate-binding protein n=1 Tax=Paenibacillus periandrae TaxID=1761741 RepID=UPI001F09644B|nr:extracellular solute-binding protein [Paenibacillus periandrae]
MIQGKTKKGLTMLLTLVFLTAIFTGCGSNEPSTPAVAEQAKKTEDLKATIKVWDWDETFLKTMIPEFNKVYPNIKVEYTVVPSKDYLQKLQSGIASGSDVPDVILGEVGSRGKLFDLDILENLEKTPYNLKKEQLLDYVVPFMSNSKNELVGVEQSITPAGLAYRRDLAKKYFGTDDPVELEKLLPDWNAFIVKGVETKEKSGGTVTMLPGVGDAYTVLKGQAAKEYVNGTQIDLTSRLKEPLETVFKMRDTGILGKYEMNTPGWAASMSKGENIFYLFAPWSAQWEIASNDKEGKGRWGLVKAPGGSFTRGGTSISLYRDSKVKEAAWAYIQFCYLTDEGTKITFQKFGNIPGIKSFYEKNRDLIEKGSENDPFFGGQNLTKYFLEKIVPDVKGERQTKYESIVNSVFKTLYPLWTKDGSINAGSALEKFKAEVKNKAPEATVK